jgi:hypothetical protein
MADSISSPSYSGSSLSSSTSGDSLDYPPEGSEFNPPSTSTGSGSSASDGSGSLLSAGSDSSLSSGAGSSMSQGTPATVDFEFYDNATGRQIYEVKVAVSPGGNTNWKVPHERVIKVKMITKPNPANARDRDIEVSTSDKKYAKTDADTIHTDNNGAATVTVTGTDKTVDKGATFNVRGNETSYNIPLYVYP